MTMKRGSRIGFGLLAVALFGAVTIEECLAEEVRAGVSDRPTERGATPPLSGAAASGSGSKLGDQSAPRADGDTATIPAGGAASEGIRHAAKDSDEIDTRITVQPKRPGRGRLKIGNTTVVKSSVSRNLLTRRTSVPTALVVRNAVGVSVPRREGLEHFTIAVHGPAAGATGIGGGAIGRVAKPDGLGERPTPNANPIAKPALVNRAAINGTTLIHPGFALSGIGGPAKAITGINGTAIRTKH
jgi:hypothetical protein